jgi:hypothetical protein
MTRQKKATRKGVPLPNPLAGGRKRPIEDWGGKDLVSRFREALLTGKNDAVVEGLKGDVDAEMPGHADALAAVAHLLSEEKTKDAAANVLGTALMDGVDISQAIPCLIPLLLDKSKDVRLIVAGIFWSYVDSGGDASVAAAELAKASFDDDIETARNAGEALTKMVERGAVSEPVMKAFARTLCTWGLIRVEAQKALTTAVERGDDVSAAFPHLLMSLDEANYAEPGMIDLLKGELLKRGLDSTMNFWLGAISSVNLMVREEFAGTLISIANESVNNRRKIMDAVMDRLRSEKFQAGMESNCRQYEKTAIGIAEFLDKLRKSEAAQP